MNELEKAMKKLAEAIHALPEDLKTKLCAEELSSTEVSPLWLWDINSN